MPEAPLANVVLPPPSMVSKPSPPVSNSLWDVRRTSLSLPQQVGAKGLSGSQPDLRGSPKTANGLLVGRAAAAQMQFMTQQMSNELSKFEIDGYSAVVTPQTPLSPLALLLQCSCSASHQLIFW